MHTNRHTPQFKSWGICKTGLGFHAQSSQTGSHWATTYIRLGPHRRTVSVQVRTSGAGHITIGVNKAHTDSCWMPVVAIPERVEWTPGHVTFEFAIECEA